jgi:hypothetical protein
MHTLNDVIRSDDLDFENATKADPARNISHSTCEASHAEAVSSSKVRKMRLHNRTVHKQIISPVTNFDRSLGTRLPLPDVPMTMMAFGMNVRAGLIQTNGSSPQTFTCQQPMLLIVEGLSHQEKFLRVSPRRKELRPWNSKEIPDMSKHMEL